MRIAILTNAFPPDGKGGAERIAFLQARGLEERGHDVKVWAPEAEPWAMGHGPWDEERAQGARPKAQGHIFVERFPSRFASLTRMSSIRRLFFHLIEDIGAKKRLVEDILSWRPDVLISHNLTGCGIGTPSAVKARGIPWIHILHDIQLTEPSGQLVAEHAGSFLGKLWRSFWVAYRKRAWRMAPDVLVSPTLWLLDWHRRYGFHGNKEEVLPNPVEAGRYRERSLHHPATLAYVGRLSADKGYADFLELAKAFNRDAVASFVVVGDGVLRHAADMLGDTRFHMKGALPPYDTRREIAHADILVAPSRILENQQTILLEAMAEGTPAVATDAGGTKETLEGTGCPVTTREHLASEVLKLLRSPEKWHSVSVAMRMRAERHAPARYFDVLVALCTGISRS